MTGWLIRVLAAAALSPCRPLVSPLLLSYGDLIDFVVSGASVFKFTYLLSGVYAIYYADVIPFKTASHAVGLLHVI